MHCQQHGNEKADTLMVFLHGGGVSSWMWEKQIQYFSHYYCITVDLPEHGRSNGKKKFSIAASAQEIAQYIQKQAGTKKVVLIGFSLGAQIALQILSIEPNLVDDAIINSALVRPQLLASRLIGPALKLTFPLVKNKTFSKIQAKTLYINEAQFDTYYHESNQLKQDALRRILHENMSFQLPHEFSKAKGKILVTVGENEKSIMKKSAMDLVEKNLNVTGIIIPYVGHGIPFADPDYFNRMIEGWIEEERLPLNAEVMIK